MLDSTDRAVTTYQDGFVCSQAVLSAFASELGLPVDLALKLAAPFGGGIARRGEMCGAVTGALMVIGLKSGNLTAQDQAAKELTYQKVDEFVERFTQRNGSITCRDLLACGISVPEELQRARDTKIFTTICPRLVRDAAEIVGGLIE